MAPSRLGRLPPVIPSLLPPLGLRSRGEVKRRWESGRVFLRRIFHAARRQVASSEASTSDLPVHPSLQTCFSEEFPQSRSSYHPHRHHTIPRCLFLSAPLPSIVSSCSFVIDTRCNYVGTSAFSSLSSCANSSLQYIQCASLHQDAYHNDRKDQPSSAMFSARLSFHSEVSSSCPIYRFQSVQSHASSASSSSPSSPCSASSFSFHEPRQSYHRIGAAQVGAPFSSLLLSLCSPRTPKLSSSTPSCLLYSYISDLGFSSASSIPQLGQLTPTHPSSKGEKEESHATVSPNQRHKNAEGQGHGEGGGEGGENKRETRRKLRFHELLRLGYISDGTYRAVRSLLGYNELTEEQTFLLPQILPPTSLPPQNSSSSTSQDLPHHLLPSPRITQPSRDCLVQARTGTGKTLCFLLCVIERLLLHPPSGVGGLVIAPTRELANQILREAEQLTTFVPVEAAALVGGNSRKADELLLKRKRPQILICTPGRLLDHLESTFTFSVLLENLQVLVLDEADRLMELGHLEELKQIISYLPRNNARGTSRQSLLFSATVTDKVKELSWRLFSKPDYRFINCIGTNEQPTHERVEQNVVVVPATQTATALYNLLREEFDRHPYNYKIIVFFPTARLTAFFAALFREQLRIGVYEIHRRRESSARATTAMRFSTDRADAGVLFSSDVSARGVDYPDVSLVIQVCAPLTRELYIHRIGRTGRIGKEGRAILLLNNAETSFLEV
ncbi:dead deah box helicase domain-containing protein [Cystoisospora suis]|uniref:ATP-dependent RNA helicase n=1 Tax=Cystoisospora suis TaxID=483139 RepID=A0A2C6KU51_9APIC|nr:dead deah box helicase domain-containing protein [Cystoisospora suis]